MDEAKPNQGTARQQGRRAEWSLTLYVAGQTPRSRAALANLTRLCETYLRGLYEIEVIDLLLNPTAARLDQIVAVPSLVRQTPPPVKKIVGDLADRERVLTGLDLWDPSMGGAVPGASPSRP